MDLKGLDLAEAYYRQYGEPMLREQFPELADKVAAGLIGSGSECLGFDDELSQDQWEKPVVRQTVKFVRHSVMSLIVNSSCPVMRFPAF